MTKSSYKIVLLPGDGVGKEVVREGEKILRAVEQKFDLNFEYIKLDGGGEYYLKTGKEWDDTSFETCKESDAILLGAVGWPGANLPDGNIAGYNIVMGLRFGLDLYANVRPVKMYKGIKHKICNEFKTVWQPGSVDFVIVRENTEGLYSPIRGEILRGGVTDVAIDTRVITRKGAERIIKFAFELARQRNGAPKDGKKRVTCIDKSNLLRGCQFFRKVFDELAKNYSEIERDYAIVDAFTQWMVRNPEFYDVCVTTNMFGDIVTDLASVLQGGLGMAAGGNIGDNHAMFEPIHGSAPKHAGKNTVNPMATILAVQMMLDWLGNKYHDVKLKQSAKVVEMSIAKVLAEGKVLTYDLGGNSSTTDVGTEIVKNITHATES